MEKKRDSKPDGGTVDRLLDAAEKLFAEYGFHGVGMRQLAAEADVNLGAATYHFGSKQSLFIETFLRRFRPTNNEQLRLLQEAEAAAGGNPIPVEKIVECLIRPPFESGLKHPVFHLFLARNLFDPPPFLHPTIHKEFAPNIEAFIRALRRTLPDVPEDLIHLRMMLSMGSLLMFSIEMGRTPDLHNARIHRPLLREMIRYISVGLQSPPALGAGERPRFPFPPKLPKK